LFFFSSARVVTVIFFVVITIGFFICIHIRFFAKYSFLPHFNKPTSGSDATIANQLFSMELLSVFHAGDAGGMPGVQMPSTFCGNNGIGMDPASMVR
jgi:hypothetical protein